MNKNGYVFVEKYRPTHFNDIVLEPTNKTILQNIIRYNYFPNLLFYGPPGTGKTTTIINLIKEYQETYNQCNKELIIHLNASDERGIDVIRNQINQFVNSKTLFHVGTKFVILDEVDYMTKNAQQALKYIIQKYDNEVRFCLICNYINRIDESLQYDFLRLRFNQLPKKDILDFLNKISVCENLQLTYETLSQIQELYKSDIRSMINFMQLNRTTKIINNTILEQLYQDIINNKLSLKTLQNQIQQLSKTYNIDKKNIIKHLLNYIIRNKSISSEFLLIVENIMHFEDCNDLHYLSYVIVKLRKLHT